MASSRERTDASHFGTYQPLSMEDDDSTGSTRLTDNDHVRASFVSCIAYT